MLFVENKKQITALARFYDHGCSERPHASKECHVLVLLCSFVSQEFSEPLSPRERLNLITKHNRPGALKSATTGSFRLAMFFWRCLVQSTHFSSCVHLEDRCVPQYLGLPESQNSFGKYTLDKFLLATREAWEMFRSGLSSGLGNGRTKYYLAARELAHKHSTFFDIGFSKVKVMFKQKLARKRGHASCNLSRLDDSSSGPSDRLRSSSLFCELELFLRAKLSGRGRAGQRPILSLPWPLEHVSLISTSSSRSCIALYFYLLGL